MARLSCFAVRWALARLRSSGFVPLHNTISCLHVYKCLLKYLPGTLRDLEFFFSFSKGEKYNMATGILEMFLDLEFFFN